MLTKAEINFLRGLSDKKEREAAGLFVAEGRKLVSDMILSGMEVNEVYAFAETMDELPSFPSVREVSKKDMERISRLKTPSDVLATVRIPSVEFDIKKASGQLTLALDSIQDPGNLGTIIRVADWFGIRNILCSANTADCFNPKVVQATMGALARVHVHYGDLKRWLEKASRREIPVYGTFLDGDSIYRAKISSSGIIVMGSEGRGVSERLMPLITRRLFIPPYPTDVPTSESLNVATATAIICSEFRRRL